MKIYIATSCLLKGALSFWEPGDLKGRGYYGLLIRYIGGSFPMLKAEVTVDLETRTNALDNLQVEVIQRSATRNEVFGRFLASPSRLNPFIPT